MKNEKNITFIVFCTEMIFFQIFLSNFGARGVGLTPKNHEKQLTNITFDAC